MRALAALACLCAAAPAAAQADAAQARGADPGSARPVEAVRAAVAQLFDGMRAADTTAVRAVLHPDARFSTVTRQGERHALAPGDVGAFLAALASSDVVWDERLGEVEVRVDDGLATAWMAYRFYAGDRFSHCGVNAMQLVQDAAGWRILNLVDTRRRGCE